MNLGLIGYGGVGSYHLELVKSVEEVKVKMVYDIDEKRLALAKSNGFNICNSYKEIINSTNIDTILIATPNNFHFFYAKLAILAGKDVLLEKPAVMNVSELEILEKLSIEKGVMLTIHQNRRYDNDFLKVKEAISNNYFNGVYKIESSVTASNGIPGAWRKIKSQGGGMILDWGVHLVDQIVKIFGVSVKSVYCKNSYVFGEEVDDGFFAEFLLNNGVLYRVEVDTNMFIVKPRWVVYGYTGTGKINSWGSPLEIKEMLIRRDENLKGITAANGLTKTMAERSEETIINKSEDLPVIPRTIFYNELIKAKNERRELVPLSEVKYVLKLLNAMEKSSAENKVIEI